MKPPALDPHAKARMSLDHVTTGKRPQPVMALVYGVEGVGKTTFGANAPDPIFLCAEKGTAQLDVARFPAPTCWADANAALAILAAGGHRYKTLVVDSLDWLEPLCWDHVCASGRKESIEDFGFGKGYLAAFEEWRKFLAGLERVRESGMHVVLIAHSQIKMFKNPEGDDFDRYLLKLDKRAAELFKEAVDDVLFATYDTTVIKNEAGKTKARSSGARVLRTERTPAYDAKNRHDLPPSIELDWAGYYDYLRAHGGVGLVAKDAAKDRAKADFDAGAKAIEAAPLEGLKKAYDAAAASPYLTDAQKKDLHGRAKARAEALRREAADRARDAAEATPPAPAAEGESAA